MAMPHRLHHKGDTNNLRAVTGTTRSVMTEDEPLTPTMTKGMEKRLQKNVDVGASGRRLIVGCDGILYPRYGCMGDLCSQISC